MRCLGLLSFFWSVLCPFEAKSSDDHRFEDERIDSRIEAYIGDYLTERDGQSLRVTIDIRPPFEGDPPMIQVVEHKNAGLLVGHVPLPALRKDGFRQGYYHYGGEFLEDGFKVRKEFHAGWFTRRVEEYEFRFLNTEGTYPELKITLKRRDLWRVAPKTKWFRAKTIPGHLNNWDFSARMIKISNTPTPGEKIDRNREPDRGYQIVHYAPKKGETLYEGLEIGRIVALPMGQELPPIHRFPVAPTCGGVFIR